MNKNNNILPEGWSSTKLIDITDKKVKWSFTGGPFGSNLKAEDYTEKGIRIIQLQNIGDGHFIDDYKIYTSTKKADELLSCNIYPNDIIISKMGDPVARACIIPGIEDRYVMSSDGIRLVCNNEIVDNFFILSYINNSHFRNEAIKKSIGSTRRRIGLDDLKNIEVQLPPLPEQQKIAKILATWDKAIKLQQQLIENKKQYKKAVMKKLLTGEVRFKGFSDKWEKSKLGDIGKIKMCKRIFNQETSKEGQIPFFKIGTFGKIADSYISEDLYLKYKEKYPFPKKGEILISAAGTLGRTVVYDGSPAYFQDSNIVWLSHDETKIINDFLYYSYKRIKYDSEGGTIQRLYNNIINNAKIVLPSINEQKKIASFLSGIDREINALETKLLSFQKQKQGLMQQLLTGNVRVKK